ncbi:hypothetical protein A2160_05350 [Candidatus Beckwithbacteria bacterium RBG_13_42_9]|uniref:NYN domain-containing protein n=1 Tax=Candidatus Beckwithbacteria bacterium RBG_13_42_9 TaxID=1797457 RepID=A0A1F5E6T2_9BACT|nr:MAG: hypothetical protein A2160_05350 [Candidatus Beckwithbacteria bacterium RBG_13_42_9]
MIKDMSKTILYIDGENLKNYVKTVLLDEGVKEETIDFENFNLAKLLELPLKGIRISEKRYYSARLRKHHKYPQTFKKSQELILKQRIQKTNLEKLGFIFIIGGNVRPQKVKAAGKTKIIFKEKGVDVRIAVDLVAEACDKKIKTALLCSSDSDLQPAVKEARKRGLEIIYVGFEANPNKGLSYTTNRTILIRNSEVLDTYRQSSQNLSKKKR